MAQKVVQLKAKISHEKALFKANVHKLKADQIQGYQLMMKYLKAVFEKRCEAVKGALVRLKKKANTMVQAHNEMLKRKGLGQPALDPQIIERSRQASMSSDQTAPSRSEP